MLSPDGSRKSRAMIGKSKAQVHNKKDPNAAHLSELMASKCNSLTSKWMGGPSNSAGTLLSLSDRPSLCMSVHGSEAAVGSSDHAVYTIDTETAALKRILYGKSYGHTEWVTCIEHAPDGRIVSGGLDSKLCVWASRGVRSIDLRGHHASISQVKVGFGGSFQALSSSYDKTLLLWDLDNPRGKPIACFQGHQAPVMAFSMCKYSIASGSRDGAIFLWDGATASAVLQCNKAHEGHVTAMECLQQQNKTIDEEARPPALEAVFLSGGQDGILRVWDFRTRSPVHSTVLHRAVLQDFKN